MHRPHVAQGPALLVKDCLGEVEVTDRWGSPHCHPWLLSHRSACESHENKTPPHPAVWVGFALLYDFSSLSLFSNVWDCFRLQSMTVFLTWTIIQKTLVIRPLQPSLAFLIMYVFLILYTWWRQIAAEVTAWEKARVVTTNLWMETCNCTKRNYKEPAYVGEVRIRAREEINILASPAIGRRVLGRFSVCFLDKESCEVRSSKDL